MVLGTVKKKINKRRKKNKVDNLQADASNFQNEADRPTIKVLTYAGNLHGSCLQCHHHLGWCPWSNTDGTNRVLWWNSPQHEGQDKNVCLL